MTNRFRPRKRTLGKEVVSISDRLVLSTPEKFVVDEYTEREAKPLVTIEGFVSVVCRERGKRVPGTHRDGKNIWTLTGREFLARLMSYASYGTGTNPDVPSRNDRIRYVGFGIGTTPENSSVSALVDPVEYTATGGGLFLAELGIPIYPFESSGSFGTAVRYTREFSETELSVSSSITLTEAGLFTDGSPTASPTPFEPLTRDLTLAQAVNQAPAAYKTFEPLTKTQNFVLEVSWEIRF